MFTMQNNISFVLQAERHKFLEFLSYIECEGLAQSAILKMCSSYNITAFTIKMFLPFTW